VRSPFRMQPGLQRVADGARQLTPNSTHDRALNEKLAVLSCFREQALLCEPGFDASAALDALATHAAQEHPQALQRHAAGHCSALLLGWSVCQGELAGEGPADIGTCLRGLPPEWRLAGLLCLAFAEDFAVIDGASARISWLAVCLPSHWAPEDKVGRHFAEVHAPVADNRLLLTASEHLARLVTGNERWERFVWTITRQPRLHTHPTRCDPTPWPSEAQADADAVAALAFWRTERQTFIPLPLARQAVFTIHVEVQPLAQALSSAQRAGQVHDALASMSPAVLAYRGLEVPRDRLLEWLDGQARQGASA
jgi:dimethylamine monooxygenase subunit A